MFKKLHSKLIYFKKISGYLKSIDFWTIVGSVATVLGLVLAVLTYQSQNNSNLNNSDANLNLKFIDTLQQNIKHKKNKLTIGVVNAVDSVKYVKHYTPFVEYISKKLNFKYYQLKILDYNEIYTELSNNTIDIGIFSPYSYYDAKKIHHNIELFAIPITNGDQGYHSIIAVKKGGKIKSLKDIKNCKFAYTHKNSTSGFRIPRKILPDSISPKNWILSGGHKKSIMLLAKDSVDAIATYTEAFDEVKYDLDSIGFSPEDFVSIASSNLIPNNAIVFSPSLDTILQKEIKTIMFNAHKDILTKDMFDSKKNELGINGWVKKDDSFYNDLRYLLDENRLKYRCLLTINTSKNTLKYFSENNNDVIPYLKKEINDRLKATNVFWNKNKENDYCGTYRIVLNIFRIKNTFKYKLELNDKIIDENTINENELISDIPKLIIYNILNNINLEAKLKFDPKEKNNQWFIEYGLENGINITSFEFILENGIIIKSTDFNKENLKSNAIIFPNKYKEVYKNNMKVIIKYKEKSP